MRKAGIWVGLMILLSGLLVACGGNTAVPNTTSAATASSNPTVAKATPLETTGATATPVVLASLAPRPTFTPVPAISAVATATRTVGSQVTLAAPTATVAPTLLPTAIPTPVPLPAGFKGKLGVIGNDFALYVNPLDGKTPKSIAGKAGQVYNQRGDAQLLQFPTWTAKGDKVAVISSNIIAGSIVSGDVIVVNADGSGTFKVLDSEPSNGIYLSWSPDGVFLTMLVSGTNGLELYLVDTSKTPPTRRKLLEGSTVYSTWATDSDTLYIHAAGNSGDVIARVKAKSPSTPLFSLGYSTPTAATTPTILAGNPTPASGLNLGDFRAPAFAPDGSRFAYAVAGATSVDSERIIIADVNGNEQARVETIGTNAAFNWSPVAGQLLLAHTITSRSSDYYEGIYLSDYGAGAPGGKITTTKIVNEPVLAFFWSPDGKKIAYVGLNDSASLLNWKVYELASGKSTTLVEWLPSREQFQILNFFDQYAQSDVVWSPDSTAIVFSGFDAQNRGSTDPNVYIVPTEGTDVGKAYLVSGGRLAFWTK